MSETCGACGRDATDHTETETAACIGSVLGDVMSEQDMADTLGVPYNEVEAVEVVAQANYIVAVSCMFEATDPEDALKQMVAWIDQCAYTAGYRVTNTVTGQETFVDAEGIDWP
jgi:hypothetical protein